jgi:putative transposase
MVKRGNRRIGSKTARAMLTWSHYRFRQRLINKQREHPWCNVIICDEHFTAR